MGVDCCIVMDHCSKDGTIEIIKKLQCEGLVQELIEEKSEKYEQSKFVHRMINLAIKNIMQIMSFQSMRMNFGIQKVEISKKYYLHLKVIYYMFKCLICWI